MSFVNEVEKHVPYESAILPQEAAFGQNMFQGLTGFMLQMGKKVIEWSRQDELIEKEREWQKQMFNLENSYNSPVAMAQRMRHAGLNPYAMTGQQVAGSFNSGSYPSSTPIDDPFDNLVKAAQIANINADTEKKQNDAEIAYQEARKKAVEADNWDEYWELTLNKLEEEGELTVAQKETEKAKALKEFELARKAAAEANAAPELAASQVTLNESMTALNNAKTEYQNIINSNADAKEKAEIEATLASAKKSFVDALAAQMQAKYIETLESNASAQEARNAALFIYQEALAKYDADVRYQESVVRHMEAKRAEIKTNNPFTDGNVEDFAQWLHYNLFGENGVINF